MTLKGHPRAEFSAAQGEVTTFIKGSPYLSSPARAWQCLQLVQSAAYTVLRRQGEGSGVDCLKRHRGWVEVLHLKKKKKAKRARHL